MVMERRTFLTGLLALAAGSGAVALAGKAEAAAVVAGMAPVAQAETQQPSGVTAELAQYRRPRRRRREVCRVQRDRFGRRRRVCRTVWY
jgi:hypothetical protein